MEQVPEANKPAVAWIVVAIAAASVASNALDVLAAIACVHRVSWSAVVGQTLQSSASAIVSAWLLRAIVQGTLRSTRPISLYLWFLLVMYPIRHALANGGLGFPGATIDPTELAGAALAEIARYVTLIVLIVWVGLSKSLGRHLEDKRPTAVE